MTTGTKSICTSKLKHCWTTTAATVITTETCTLYIYLLDGRHHFYKWITHQFGALARILNMFRLDCAIWRTRIFVNDLIHYKRNCTLGWRKRCLLQEKCTLHQGQLHCQFFVCYCWMVPIVWRFAFRLIRQRRTTKCAPFQRPFCRCAHSIFIIW